MGLWGPWILGMTEAGKRARGYKIQLFTLPSPSKTCVFWRERFFLIHKSNWLSTPKKAQTKVGSGENKEPAFLFQGAQGPSTKWV